MRNVTVTAPGGPENLTISDAPRPSAGSGEVVISVRAAGVNRADLLQRQGHYPPPPGISDVIGLEVSGTIESVGGDVTGWSIGDECIALLAGGGYAELVSVPSGQVVRQDPASGAKVTKGSAVNIVVSSGSPSPSPSPSAATVTIPNVYGMDSTTATDQLTAAGLLVVVHQKGGTGQPPGTVVSMVPDAGNVVDSGSTVLLVIAK